MKQCNNKILVVLGLSILLFTLIFACGKDKTPTEPEPQRQEISWLNESFTVGPGNYKAYYGDLQQGDTLNLEITLLQGDFIAQVLVVDETNFNKWLNNEAFSAIFYRTNSTGGNFKASVPSNGTYYFVVYNSAVIVTIEVSAEVTIIRWS